MLHTAHNIYKMPTFIDRPLLLSLIFPTLFPSPCLLVIALLEGHYNEQATVLQPSCLQHA